MSLTKKQLIEFCSSSMNDLVNRYDFFNSRSVGKLFKRAAPLAGPGEDRMDKLSFKQLRNLKVELDKLSKELRNHER